jgi:hypothetical protein
MVKHISIRGVKFVKPAKRPKAFRNDSLTGESRDSSAGIALGYGLEDRGSRVRFLARAVNFLFITQFRTALESTQPPIEWLPGALALG